MSVPRSVRVNCSFCSRVSMIYRFSVGFRAGGVHDGCPALHLRGHVRGELLRIEIAGLDAFGPEPLANVGKVEDTPHLGVQATDDLGRDSGRGRQSPERRGAAYPPPSRRSREAPARRHRARRSRSAAVRRVHGRGSEALGTRRARLRRESRLRNWQIMLTREQNEQLTRTDRGTLMGDLLRRYWIPALHGREIAEPDSPPVRVQLLGEKLVAFRDSEGRIGVIDEFCAHRSVSLWFGRNEECGLRCPYHGWKYDITGQCVDLPSEPGESGMRQGIKLKSYPAIERGDVVWIYMGPPELKPAPPELEWVMVPPERRFVSKRLQESNYLQAIEGGID